MLTEEEVYSALCCSHKLHLHCPISIISSWLEDYISLYVLRLASAIRQSPFTGDLGGISLLTVPLSGYRNGKLVNCLFLKTTIRTALS